ncbi:MAG TPA: sigma-70 family RNA polymerase sigma factor [Cytophagaceae bacterium]|nr:sigma-70 family RNA polymerase sigma factor [Cytophagaceae bacterium]
MSIHQSTEEIKNELAIITKAKVDPNRFSALYEKYYKQIFLFIHRRTDDEDNTADLTSQVFLKAILNLPKYEYKGVPFSAWLYRIASNEVNQYFRQAKTTRAISIEEEGLSRLMGELNEEPEEQHEKEQIIMESLNHLTKEEIQYLELRFFEDKSFREIGYILLVTENNAKVRTYRIIDKIKKMIRERK